MTQPNINADEIRSIVAQLVREGRASYAPTKPARSRYSGRTPAQNRLRVIECDQCGTRFMKRCSVHRRCSPECSRKANAESVRRWHVERGLLGTPCGKRTCDQCGQTFQQKNKGHRFCTAECRVLGKR